MFLLRDENAVMANIAAISTKLHGGANNETLKLETLARSVGADLQAINSHNQLFADKKSWKSLKNGWKVEKLEKRQPIFLKYIFEKKSLDCSEKSLGSLDERKNR